MESNGRVAPPVSIEEVIQKNYKYSILLDDAYFYYVSIGKLNISRKKAKGIIFNYLLTIFPPTLFKGFAILNNGNNYKAMLYREDFHAILSKYSLLFKRARTISTALAELDSRFTSFVFNDGNKLYRKDEAVFETIQDTDNIDALVANDLWGELIPLKSSVELPGIQKQVTGVAVLRIPAVILAVCYVMFFISNFMGYKSDVKVLQHYENQLKTLYESAGVADKGDPYGILLSLVAKNTNVPYRFMDILATVTKSTVDGVLLESISANERSIRVEGLSDTFEIVEKFKKNLEENTMKTVYTDDSRQTNDRIKFSLRFEP